MAQITITIPDAQIERVRTALQIRTGNSNMSNADLKQYFVDHLKEQVRGVEEGFAEDAARASVSDVDVT